MFKSPWFMVYLFLTILGPVTQIIRGEVDFNGKWYEAKRSGTNLAPDPIKTTEAIVQVYGARAYSWRGLFGLHTWIALKPRNAKEYLVYQAVGWRLFRNQSIVSIGADIPDRLWFNRKPKIFYDLRGKKAEELIPKIIKVAEHYPYPKKYTLWPGPNSNTFIANIGRSIPEMQLVMPSNAIGKDFLPGTVFAKTPSGTGYQISIFGMLGITLAKLEGIEINILGLVYGFSPALGTLKLPGFDDIVLY